MSDLVILNQHGGKNSQLLNGMLPWHMLCMWEQVQHRHFLLLVCLSECVQPMGVLSHYMNRFVSKQRVLYIYI